VTIDSETTFYPVFRYTVDDVRHESKKFYTLRVYWMFPPQLRIINQNFIICLHTHTHTHRLMALCPVLPGWAGTRKAKPIWILLKQETVSGSGIIWTICKSAPRSREITMPTPHHSGFYRPEPFLLPNQQPQSTEGHVICLHVCKIRTTKFHSVNRSNVIQY